MSRRVGFAGDEVVGVIDQEAGRRVDDRRTVLA